MEKNKRVVDFNKAVVEMVDKAFEEERFGRIIIYNEVSLGEFKTKYEGSEDNYYDEIRKIYTPVDKEEYTKEHYLEKYIIPVWDVK